MDDIASPPAPPDGPYPNRFRPGESGNPAGRPRGSRNRAALLMEQLLGEEIEDVTRAAAEKARKGDVGAMRLCMQRAAPAARGRAVLLDLPANATIEDLSAAMTRTIEAMGAGEITPTEAEEIARVLDVQRRFVETLELERRLTQLEEMVGAKPCYDRRVPA
jgi:hypothetical protein